MWRLKCYHSWRCALWTISCHLNTGIVSTGIQVKGCHWGGRWNLTVPQAHPPPLSFVPESLVPIQMRGAPLIYLRVLVPTGLSKPGTLGPLWLEGMGWDHHFQLFTRQGGPLDASTCCLTQWLAHSRCSLNEWMNQWSNVSGRRKLSPHSIQLPCL